MDVDYGACDGMLLLLLLRVVVMVVMAAAAVFSVLFAGSGEDPRGEERNGILAFVETAPVVMVMRRGG